MNYLHKETKSKIKLSYIRYLITRHGFWFVDIPRTSSSSIRSELGKKFGKAHGKINILETEHAVKQIIIDHRTAIEMRDFIGQLKWGKLFTFSAVRNPWDRIFSIYHYRKKKNDIPKQWSFKDYVYQLEKATAKSEHFKYRGYRFGASDYILGEDGKIIVDFIARYENRDEDLKVIAKRLSLKNFGKLKIQSAKPKGAHYSEFYDLETQEIIRRLYFKDIELFDYKFETLRE